MRVYPALTTLLDVWTVVFASALVGAGICGLVAAGLSFRDGRRNRSRESRGLLRISQRFADRVAKGDFYAAEAAAAQAFAEAGRPRIVGWDERAVLDLSLEEARRELTETAAAATWFPDVRRVTRGDVVEVVLGREEPIQQAAGRGGDHRDGSHVHSRTVRRGRRPAMPLQPRHDYAAGIHRGLPTGDIDQPKSSPLDAIVVRVRVATQP